MDRALQKKQIPTSITKLKVASMPEGKGWSQGITLLLWRVLEGERSRASSTCTLFICMKPRTQKLEING